MTEVVRKSTRLFYIDAMRAWAILMMLQGHFIDGLLDNAFRDPENIVFVIWKYFRGITAPVFFTVSGFIFTYLLIRVPEKGLKNPRIKKGLRRGLQLLAIGYLLRLNVFGLFKGIIYSGFYLVDVLHIIGLAILGIIGIYLLTYRLSARLFAAVLLIVTILLFALEPWYSGMDYPMLPTAIANYLTRVHGSVFTIIPWFGYTAAGGFLAMAFWRFRSNPNLYGIAIPLAGLTGGLLVWFSSPLIAWVYELTGWRLLFQIQINNYLFIRLGDVLLAFAVFMILRKLLMHQTILRIGQNTLSIYVIHFIILYGSFTGLGLYQFFDHSLSPTIVIPGAIAFMIVCSYLALKYDTHEELVRRRISQIQAAAVNGIKRVYKSLTSKV